MTTTVDSSAAPEGVPSQPGAPVTIFLHIPKAAGITLRRIAQRQYDADELCKAGNFFKDPERSLRLTTQFIEEHGKTLRFLEGHVPFGIHELLPRPTTYITLLRDPVERVISHYYHFLADAPDAEGLEAALTAGSHLVDDLQTRLLSGLATQFGQCSREVPEGLSLVLRDSEQFEPSTPAMLEAAKRNLRERFSMVGLVEHFDESLLMLRQALGWNDVLYVRENMTENRPRREELPRPTLVAIEGRNRLDNELYAYARQLFEERVDGQPADFRRRVRAFQVVNTWFREVSAASPEREPTQPPELPIGPDDDERAAALVRAHARVFLLESELSGRIDPSLLGESSASVAPRLHARIEELTAALSAAGERAQEGERDLAEKNARLSAANEEHREELKAARAREAELSSALGSARADVEGLTARATALAGELQQARTAVSGHEQRLRALETRESEMAEKLKQAHARTAARQREVERLTGREGELLKHVKRLGEQVTSLEQRNAGIIEREEALHAEITWLREQRVWMKERHEDESQKIQILRERVAELQGEMAKATAERAEYERAIADLTGTINALQAEDAALREQFEGLRARLAELRRESNGAQAAEATHDLRAARKEMQPAKAAHKRRAK